VSVLYGSGPLYKVEVFCTDDECPDMKTFEGDRAFTDANACFEECKRRDDAVGLWLLRLDGGEWKFVAKLKRNECGEWVVAAD
jgi:hypothetical protein